jgi:RHS repeat-associated protein
MFAARNLLFALTCSVLAVPAWAGHTLTAQEQKVLESWLAHYPQYRAATDQDCDCADDIKEMKAGSGGVWKPVPDYHPYAATGDPNGNTTTKTDSTGTTNYSWDFENRLTSVTLPGSGGTVTFKYDPLGRRIYKSSSAGTSMYAYDGDNLVEESNAAGGVVARYTQTDEVDEPLAMLRSSSTSYYHADGLGSITSLSNAAGALAQTYTFDSFGRQTASSGSLTNPFQFTSCEFDSETMLYFMRARYFDLSTGRFLSEDPLRFFSGDGNFYEYATQNPIMLTDPYGLKCKCTYSQSTGHLKCVDDSGNIVAEADGYGGNGAGKNNPDMQNVPNVGPLPRGNYGMGPARNSPNTGPITIPLNYLGGDEPFPSNRSPDLMRIHGDKKNGPQGNASKGCIIANQNARKKIADGCEQGSTLSVTP